MQTQAPQSSPDRRAQLQAAFAEFRGQQTQVAALGAELAEARRGNALLSSRLTALLRSLPGGVLVLDAQRRIEECNPSALQLLGEPLLGLEFDEALARAAVADVQTPERVELRNGRFASIARRALGDGGEVVLLADITQSHLMQVLIARQQRLLTLGELAAGLAHQIRTPLAAALLYASQMALPGRGAEDLARCGAKTTESLKQLDRLVTEMLAFARGGAERERVNVSALLEQVAQWLRPAMRERLTLTIRTEAPTLSVRANASSLTSAVLNLAINALQAASGPLALEILARRGAPGRAQILVSDDGPGVPEGLRERIFEPYFTTRSHGTGIGLAIVKSVVEAHHGHVSLADGAVGASFVIDLPAEEGA